MREKVKEFLTDPHNLDLIQNNEWGKIYDKELDNYNMRPDDIGEFTYTLLNCGINPLKYELNYIPNYYLWKSVIEEYRIPDSVISIGYSAFALCSPLTSVLIGDSVKYIGNDAFYKCTSLTNIVIPNSVISIGSEAFRACSSLTSIVIPDSVETIGFNAFYACDSLASVKIGKSVKSIGKCAFCNCSKLASIKFNGTVAEWDNIEKGTNWNQNILTTKITCMMEK